MAKDFYDKLKTWSDIIKDHKVLVLMGLTALSSGLTNLGQMIYGEEKDMLIGAMKEQITILAPKPAIKPKAVTVRSNCGKCGGYFDKKINEYDFNHIKNAH